MDNSNYGQENSEIFIIKTENNNRFRNWNKLMIGNILPLFNTMVSGNRDEIEIAQKPKMKQKKALSPKICIYINWNSFLFHHIIGWYDGSLIL